MTEKAIILELPPHLNTEEGAKRFNAAVEERNQADYECFVVLRDLNDEGFLTTEALARGLAGRNLWQLGEDDKECVLELAERANEALSRRRKADAEFANALRGISD